MEKMNTPMVLSLFFVLFWMSGCAVVKYTTKTQPDIPYSSQDYLHPEELVDSSILVYRPQGNVAATDVETRLLHRYAPVIVQGVLSSQDHAYDPKDDRIGTPILTPQADGYRIDIHPQYPVLYSRIEYETVHDQVLTQLVYVYWYPRHPVGLVEKGKLDGGVFRITLDAQYRPAVYEHVWPCGCYHNVFVGRHVEEAARDEFAALVKGKDRYTEKKVPHRFDWNVQDIVPDPADGERPVLLVSPGKHRVLALQIESTVGRLDSFPEITYTLEPYRRLTSLPVQTSPPTQASLFTANQLVWGGRRIREEILFFGLLNHAGWPRHLDAVQIHWDEADWNDPHLLSTYLRLPHVIAAPR